MPPKSRSKAVKSKTSKKNVSTTKPSSRKTRQTIASLGKQFGLSSDDDEDDNDEEELAVETVKGRKTTRANGRTAKTTAKNTQTTTKATKAKKPRSKRAQKVVEPESDSALDEAEQMDDSDKEEDDGFVFTRAKASKAKKPSRKRKQQDYAGEPTPPSSPPQVKTRRANTRKTRNENKSPPNPDTNETPFPAKRLRTNEPIFTTQQSNETTTINLTEESSNTPENSHTMALPISDTPVIRRNQELRRKSGVRRSSLGNRGKRMSSIGNGFVAEPHEEVDFKEFYKHSSTDDSEPVRMRQILTWCSKRALESHLERDHRENSRKKSSMEDTTARKIAQVIKDEIVRDLVEMKITTSWWSRPEEPVAEERPKRPNANNITNEQNFTAFQQKLQDLQNEKRSWLAMLESFRDKTPENLAPDARKLASQREAQMTAINDHVVSFDTAHQRCKELGTQIDKLYDAVYKIKSLSEATGMFRDNKMQELHESLPHTRTIPQPPIRDTLRTLSRVDK